MTINRRELALPVLGLALLGAGPAWADSADEEAVAKKVEEFRKAQLASDGKALGALCWDELSYSHSSGVVQDKAEFIAGSTDPKVKFNSVDYQDVKIRIVGPAAIVRFHWLAEQESVPDGKKSATNLHILMNWLKQGSDWKLLSRGSTKLG
jgi:ketosteroid isomerase-like protein